MASGGDFINLLSSDDEAAAKPAISKPSFVNAPVALTTPSRDDCLYLSDEFDSTVNLDVIWGAQSAKKRKLSSCSEDGIAHPGPSKAGANGACKQTTAYKRDEWTTIDEDDPIIFTSSAHADASGALSGATVVLNRLSPLLDNSDDSFPEDLLGATLHSKKCKTKAGGSSRQDLGPTASGPVPGSSGLSDKTLALLASLSESNSSGHPIKLAKDAQISHNTSSTIVKDLKLTKNTKPNSRSRHAPRDSEEDAAGPSGSAPRTKRSRLTEEEKLRRAEEKERGKEAKAREKALFKEQKAKDKEKDLEQKLIAKEQKAKQKRVEAEVAEVNKAKLDKKDSTPEMIVDLPASINGDPLDTQTRAFLKELGVETSLYESTVPNVVKWRRKVKAKWNAEQDQWEPLPRMQIQDEKHVMCIMPATEFVSMATAQVDQDVETHVAKLKSTYPDCVPIYLIEGLRKWMKNNKNARKQAFERKVADQAYNDASNSQQSNKRKKPTPEIVDEDLIEDALLRLQVMNSCLVHHTPFYTDTAQWIATFTQHISTVPYKMQRMNLETSFCMESGQVKTGEDKDDTYVKMLQEVVRVTPQIAFAIAGKYPTVVSLVKGFREKGELGLQNLQKLANRNGAVSDGKVGPAISQRLYKIFTELDPTFDGVC